jgi:hypothetical protein
MSIFTGSKMSTCLGKILLEGGPYEETVVTCSASACEIKKKIYIFFAVTLLGSVLLQRK